MSSFIFAYITENIIFKIIAFLKHIINKCFWFVYAGFTSYIA